MLIIILFALLLLLLSPLLLLIYLFIIMALQKEAFFPQYDYFFIIIITTGLPMDKVLSNWGLDKGVWELFLLSPSPIPEPPYPACPQLPKILSIARPVIITRLTLLFVFVINYNYYY